MTTTRTRNREYRERKDLPVAEFDTLPWETKLMCRYFALGREKGYFMSDDGKRTLPHTRRRKRQKKAD